MKCGFLQKFKRRTLFATSFNILLLIDLVITYLKIDIPLNERFAEN